MGRKGGREGRRRGEREKYVCGSTVVVQIIFLEE